MGKLKYTIGIDEVERAALKLPHFAHPPRLASARLGEAKRAILAQQSYVIGIDEVGRGPLAGPVVVAAVALPLKLNNLVQYLNDRSNIGLTVDKPYKQNAKGLKDKIPLKDSKKLTPEQREVWFDYYIKSHPQISYALASVSPKVIDKINISQATNLAAQKALHKLLTSLTIVKNVNKNTRISVFLDGGLYLSKFLLSAFPAPQKLRPQALAGEYFLNSKTVIKGDEKIPAIMLASIVAKVNRDRLMRRYGKKFPQYGFTQHKGYGTKKHFSSLKKFGPCPIHRFSFLKSLTYQKNSAKLK